jgi:hypothetical protein
MKPVTISPKAQTLLATFFQEGKIRMVGYSDTVNEVESFLQNMGFRPMYGFNCNSVSFALNKRDYATH